MSHDKREAVESGGFIKRHLPEPPEVGVMTGTGLGAIARAVTDAAVVEYADIPHFPVSTVEGHPGRLLAGRMGSRPAVVLQGRFHLYEGYSPRAVAFPVRVLQELGVQTLILTNAAGGLNRGFSAGDIMVIRDHVNLTGENPLVGPNEETWGVRFPDMSAVYDRGLATAAETAAEALGFRLRRGVYAGLKGPSLETPAEIRFLQAIGCDAVGLSTVQEVIAAVHGGMRVLGLSTITNIGDPDAPRPATLEEIIAVADAAAPKVAELIAGVVASLP